MYGGFVSAIINAIYKLKNIIMHTVVIHTNVPSMNFAIFLILSPLYSFYYLVCHIASTFPSMVISAYGTPPPFNSLIEPLINHILFVSS